MVLGPSAVNTTFIRPVQNQSTQSQQNIQEQNRNQNLSQNRNNESTVSRESALDQSDQATISQVAFEANRENIRFPQNDVSSPGTAITPNDFNLNARDNVPGRSLQPRQENEPANITTPLDFQNPELPLRSASPPNPPGIPDQEDTRGNRPPITPAGTDQPPIFEGLNPSAQQSIGERFEAFA